MSDYTHTCDLTNDQLTHMTMDEIAEHNVRHALKQGKKLDHEVAALLRLLDEARDALNYQRRRASTAEARLIKAKVSS